MMLLVVEERAPESLNDPEPRFVVRTAMPFPYAWARELGYCGLRVPSFPQTMSDALTPHGIKCARSPVLTKRWENGSGDTFKACIVLGSWTRPAPRGWEAWQIHSPRSLDKALPHLCL